MRDWIRFAVLLIAVTTAAPAAAQAPAYGTAAAPARDDVQWEERRVPYRGGPIRPGMQLDGSINGWTWLGVAGFLGGEVLGIVIGVANERAYGAIPLVGPWLAVANVGGDLLQWDAAAVAGMVIAGILQPAGIIAFVLALMNPNLSLVYDAPVGGPDPYARVRVAPSAPGADVGLSVTLEAF